MRKFVLTYGMTDTPLSSYMLKEIIEVESLIDAIQFGRKQVKNIGSAIYKDKQYKTDIPLLEFDKKFRLLRIDEIMI